MKTLDELSFPDVGQTIILKEYFGPNKMKQSECIVEGVYPNFILVEHKNNKVRESFMKVDFITGSLEFEKTV